MKVWITPTLEADYTRRGVYPHLRIKEAKTKKSGQGLFELPFVEAQAIFEDAWKQHLVSRGVEGRGTRSAYSLLVIRLGPLLDKQPIKPAAPRPLLEADALAKIRRDGRIAGVMLDAFEASSARLQVGQKVKVPTGEEVEIVEGFDAYQVEAHTQRRLGYVVRMADGEEFFYPAGSLTRLDCKPAHLRLAWDAQKRRAS